MCSKLASSTALCTHSEAEGKAGEEMDTTVCTVIRGLAKLRRLLFAQLAGLRLIFLLVSKAGY